jgi:hypothetical protein
MKIALVDAEKKRRPIWGWSIQAKRTVDYVLKDLLLKDISFEFLEGGKGRRQDILK